MIVSHDFNVGILHMHKLVTNKIRQCKFKKKKCNSDIDQLILVFKLDAAVAIIFKQEVGRLRY